MGTPRRLGWALQPAAPDFAGGQDTEPNPAVSLRKQIKDNGKKYFDRVKRFTNPGAHSSAIQDSSSSQDKRFNHTPIMAGFDASESLQQSLSQSNPNPTTPDKSRLSHDDQARLSCHTHDESRAGGATRYLPRMSIASFAGGLRQASGSESISHSPETSIKKGQGPRYWLRMLKGYTTFIKAPTIQQLVTQDASEPDIPTAGDLMGVGSHFPQSHTAEGPFTQHSQLKTSNTSQGLGSHPIGTPQDPAVSIQKASTASTHSYHRRSITGVLKDNHDGLAIDNFSAPNLSRRFSNDTNPVSVGAPESIFDRPSSIVSSATSTWDLSNRLSSIYMRNSSNAKQTMSCSSLNTNNTQHSEVELDDNPISNLSNSLVSVTQAVDDLVNCQENCISDQGTTTGWVTQRRHDRDSRIPEIFRHDKSTDNDIEHDASQTEINLTAMKDLETASKSGLSIIEEQCSDAGCSNHDAIPDRGDPGESTVARHLSVTSHHSIRRARSCSEIETVLGPPSLLSTDSRARATTPATSVADRLGSDISEIIDASDDNDTMSDFSDETDESLFDAFAATSLDQGFCRTVVVLKDHVSSLVLERITQWIRACSPGGCGGDSMSNYGSSFNTCSGNPSSQDNSSKKRGFYGGGSDRGNGDDQGKRRKTDNALVNSREIQPPRELACPFSKRYPKELLPDSCGIKGWAEVRRIKEHIYRKHQIPLHCDRCFEEFRTEAQLTQHLRQDERCEVVSPINTIIGIDSETKKRLKSRRGMQNLSEETRWQHMYKIIFPDDEEVPSPYHDPQTPTEPMKPESFDEYIKFLRREVPGRAISKITKNILKMPEMQQRFEGFERSLSGAIHNAVWDAFDNLFQVSTRQLTPPVISRHPSSESTASGIRNVSTHRSGPSTPWFKDSNGTSEQNKRPFFSATDISSSENMAANFMMPSIATQDRTFTEITSANQALNGFELPHSSFNVGQVFPEGQSMISSWSSPSSQPGVPKLAPHIDLVGMAQINFDEYPEYSAKL